MMIMHEHRLIGADNFDFDSNVIENRTQMPSSALLNDMPREKIGKDIWRINKGARDREQNNIF